MEQICTALWAGFGIVAVLASRLVSYLLDNWGKFSAWFQGLPAGVKRAFYAGVTALIGGALWFVGRYVIACPGWPADLDILYMIAVAVASWFVGGKAHEQAKRKEAEAEVARLEPLAKHGK